IYIRDLESHEFLWRAVDFFDTPHHDRCIGAGKSAPLCTTSDHIIHGVYYSKKRTDTIRMLFSCNTAS
ncbi:hypothetical protein NRB16_29385, partial [Pseudomonas sp. LJDD11]|uniref:hypothetical protein n=1 Tax=Pseudomonas sp. LJDD11 TaxID=2931984 RepID=UPI00211C6471